MKNTLLFAVVSLLLPIWVQHVSAHDIWLAPHQFVSAPGDTLVVRQWAGSELDPEIELELLKYMTPRFELVTPHGTTNLLAALPDGEIKPVLTRSLDFEGTALLTMEHAFFLTALSNEKFLEYLEHEEFDEKMLRAGMGQRAKQRERFARAFKCLIQVGEKANGDVYRQVLGQKIELVLQQNPYLLNPGERLDVQVLFEGKPLAGKLLKAFNKDSAGEISESKARTNAQGIAQFTLDKPGIWMLRFVQLRPCVERSAGDCDGVDWESYWTSYTFELS